jgi:hypothetical protein
MITINEIAKINYDWVESSGWHNKTPLGGGGGKYQQINYKNN